MVWAREYSAEDARRCDCNALQEALSKVPGAKRMVNVISDLLDTAYMTGHCWSTSGGALQKALISLPERRHRVSCPVTHHDHCSLGSL